MSLFLNSLMILFIFLITAQSAYANCKILSQHSLSGTINQTRLMADLHLLSDDWMQGRKTGTTGNKRAQQFLEYRFTQLGLRKFNHSYKQPFRYPSGFSSRAGTNLVAMLTGTQFADQYIVITAHYDHLGKQGNRIFNGADDNASGVAAMLALARYLTAHAPRHSIIFVATDAEEVGLYGAKAFVANPPVDQNKIVLNINLDMVAQGGKRKRLYIAGTRHNNALRTIIAPYLETSKICLKFGHDTKSRGARGDAVSTLLGKSNTIDWRNASDHAAFINAGIPYLYFGVDEHPYYHTEQDTAERIEPIFYTAVTEAILAITQRVDQQLSTSTP
ncbi:M20/M25/M40 family metallo-hydrolase [Flocculibacter collagenilyticus]|uniref:M20/M25/M40 family metallo-hydrolase n=1 Tax=Flocculibacter collagenilyticus TaxID=2744479 RepID=UPI0018F68B81|nr:M20/M25/M40 family metallo-hydrolase [Flocculibacter collagenilyticus]